MKTITAIIERAQDGTYSVYCEKEMFSGMGGTITEAKADMVRQMEFFKKTAIDNRIKYPAFLDEPFEVSYRLDTCSLIKYYIKTGAFSLAALARITGIDQKQLWSYTNGTKPRKAQEERIKNGLYRLSQDLNAVFA